MILAMHYLAIAFLIGGMAYDLNIFYNISIGIFIGMAVGHWYEYRSYQRKIDAMYADTADRIIKMEADREKDNAARSDS